jgi:CheY-like chemotaxis protein
MPGMDGRQLISRFQARRPGTPVICMTGYAGSADQASDYGQDLAALITKPFSAAVLRRVVAAACARV